MLYSWMYAPQGREKPLMRSLFHGCAHNDNAGQPVQYIDMEGVDKVGIGHTKYVKMQIKVKPANTQFTGRTNLTSAAIDNQDTHCTTSLETLTPIAWQNPNNAKEIFSGFLKETWIDSKGFKNSWPLAAELYVHEKHASWLGATNAVMAFKPGRQPVSQIHALCTAGKLHSDRPTDMPFTPPEYWVGQQSRSLVPA